MVKLRNGFGEKAKNPEVLVQGLEIGAVSYVMRVPFGNFYRE